MSLINRKKRHGGDELADATTSTNLYKKDYEKIEQLRKRTNKRHAEYVRDLVRDALIEDKLATRNDSAETNSSVSIDSLLNQRLEPLTQELQDLKGCMQELALRRGNESVLSLETFDAFIDQINKCLGYIHDRQERTERWAEAAYVLAGQSFNAILAFSDLFQRYVLIPQIAALDPQGDAVRLAQREMDASTTKAASRRKNLERRLKLPKNGKVKFLSEQLPQTKSSAV